MPLQLPIEFLKVCVGRLQGFQLSTQGLGMPMKILEVPFLLIKGGLQISQFSLGFLQGLVGVV
jgi:hypothetical protein